MIGLTGFQTKNIDVILWFFFIITFGGLFVLSFVYVVPAEDAVILYEYAKNLAKTGLITYGGSEIPIEGATDFLWMVVIAALKAIGINEFASSLVLNFLGLALVASFFRNPIEKVLVGAAFLLTPFLYSSFSGFSTISFSAVYIISIKLLFDKSKYLYISLLVLCLVRPDGVVWGAGVVLIRIFQVENSEELKIEISRCFGWLIVPGLLYFASRYWYFGELLPLPFLVKSSGPASFFIFHLGSLAAISVVLLPVIFTLGALIKSKEEAIRILILFLMPVLFYAVMRLDQNIGNRFLAPMFFAGLYIFSRFYGTRAIAIFVSLSAFTMLNLTVNTADSVVSSSRENIYYISKDLKELQGRMLITEAGRLTYYSDWFSEDSWGLNTPRFAHNLITVEDVEAGDYDLSVGHCNLSLLDSKKNLNQDGQRSWLNQCKTLVSYIKQSDFDVYLVPFLNDPESLIIRYLVPYLNDPESLKIHIKKFLGRPVDAGTESCARHDIYAIAPSYENREKLEKLIYKHGGISYNASIKIVNDTVCISR